MVDESWMLIARGASMEAAPLWTAAALAAALVSMLSKNAAAVAAAVQKNPRSQRCARTTQTAKRYARVNDRC